MKTRNPTILAMFEIVATWKKQWAATRNDEWIKSSSDMSQRMLFEFQSKDVKQLAREDYDYWQMRASLTWNPYGGKQQLATDPFAKSMWIELEKNNPEPLFKHYKCFKVNQEIEYGSKTHDQHSLQTE